MIKNGMSSGLVALNFSQNRDSFPFQRQQGKRTRMKRINEILLTYGGLQHLTYQEHMEG